MLQPEFPSRNYPGQAPRHQTRRQILAVISGLVLLAALRQGGHHLRIFPTQYVLLAHHSRTEVH